DWYVHSFCNWRPHWGIDIVGRKIAKDVSHFFRKAVHRDHSVGADGAGCFLIGSRCPSQSQINPSREQRPECAKLLGNNEWRMVRQHNPTRSNPNSARATSDVGYKYHGGDTCYADHVMVFGKP